MVKFCNDLECKKCFNKSFASNEKSKYWSHKNDILPHQVSKSNKSKFLFNCSCGHEFSKSLSKINIGQWCQYCCKNKGKLCGDINCLQCFNKSFASNEKSKYWSDKNNSLPLNIFKKSGKKFLFNCNCGHEFSSTINHITNGGTWCPYCCIYNNILCGKINCKQCFDNSFASNYKSKYLSIKNNIQPININKSSGKKYIFNCDCGHEFISQINSITNGGTWCPYCCISPQKLCNDLNCILCFEHSFASNSQNKYWSIENKVLPREVMKGTANKYLFVCKNNHLFERSLNSITTKNSWCSICKHKTEQKLYDWLKNNFLNFTIICQYKINNFSYKYDFYIKELNLLIELDGIQHFQQVAKWKSPEFTLKNDIEKIKLSIMNNYSIIHILQEDVLFNNYNWDLNLKKIINKYNKSVIYFINNKNIYKNHINELLNNNYNCNIKII